MKTNKIIIIATCLLSMVNGQWSNVLADDFVPAVETIPNNTSTSYTLNSGDSAGDVTLTFGTSLNESLKWNSSLTQFDLSDDLSLTGGITTSAGATISGATNNLNVSSNFATNINTGSSTGAVSIGNSSAGAVSITSGAAFTLTGGAASTVSTTAGNIKIQPAGTGTIANVQIGEGGAGSTTPDYLALDVKSTTGDPAGGTEGYMYYNTFDNKFRCYENAAWKDCDTTGSSTSLQAAYGNGAGITTASATPIAFTLTSGGFNVTGAGATAIGNNAGTVAIDSTSWDISSAGVASGLTGITSAGGAISLNNNSNFAVDIATGSSTGTVTLGGTGTQTIAVGNGAGNKTVNLGSLNDGSTTTLLSGSGGLNLNASNNQPTNINTGSSGTVSIGTGTGNVAIGNSTGTTAVTGSNWNISTAGVATLKGITSTGTVDFSGATTIFKMPQGNGLPGTCTVGEIFYNTADNTTYVCTALNTWTKMGKKASNFEDVYGEDGDSTMTTSNGIFTLTAGSGAVNLNSTGGINLNNNINGVVNVGTGSSTSAVTAGGGSNTVQVNSSNWKVSTAGVASGLTGLTTTGTVSLGNNTGTVAVDSSDWDISTTGAMTGIGTITMDGLLTGTLGATLSGATINLNDSSNFAVNIGSGTSTGTVSIASGSGTQTVQLGDGSTGVKTVTLGSSNTTSTTAIQSGSGGVDINVNNNQPTDINTGTSTGAVNIGGGSNTATIGGGTAITGVRFGTCAFNPPNIAANSIGTANCTATGVTTSDKVFVTAPTGLENTLVLQSATASAANTITIYLQNTQSTSAVNGASLTWSWLAIR